MGIFEIIVIIAAVLIVGGVVGKTVWDKTHGKSTGCDCGCSGCSACPHCAARPKSEKKK